MTACVQSDSGPALLQIIQEDSVAVHATGAAKRSANTESGRGSSGSEMLERGDPSRQKVATAKWLGTPFQKVE